MDETVLYELARRWEKEADASESGALNLLADKEVGRREAKRDCADKLRMLVDMLGDPSKE